VQRLPPRPVEAERRERTPPRVDRLDPSSKSLDDVGGRRATMAKLVEQLLDTETGEVSHGLDSHILFE
jgi:hypothetical protein